MPEPAQTAIPPATDWHPLAGADQGKNRGLLALLRRRRPWDSLKNLSSVQRGIEQFLADRQFERAPWLAVAYGAGIGAWVMLPGPWQWAAFLTLCAAVLALAPVVAREGRADHCRMAIIGLSVMAAAGCATIWMKSSLIGTMPLAARESVMMAGRIVDRQDDGAAGRVRLMLAARIAGRDQPALIQVDLPDQLDRPGLTIGASIMAKARLAPVAPPMLPGAHDFAFTAWFQGVAATGSIAGPITVLSPGQQQASLRGVQDTIRDHVLAHLGGSAGAIAVTLASGDRGAISRGDADAMRDAGFAHLLSISGLHVSAVIAGVYFLVFRGLGLMPWIALRVRLPLVAALCGALAGIGYCLLTGAQIPTVRAVAGAVLVLGALAMGRDPLSMRLLAVAAVLVMLIWPESLFGASFQMSFGAVVTIVALYGLVWVRQFIAWRDEGRVSRLARRLVMLLIGGLAIEFALLPVALFHFHRAGVYGALANLVAIPLVTLVTMPCLALALVLDQVGCGGPAWWAVGRSLDLMLWVAHTTAATPGAVTTLPAMAGWVYGVWIAGTLWLALWSGRVRLWGMVPIFVAVIAWSTARAPDILIAGDGRHVGITGLGPDLVVFSEGRGNFARDVLLENAGMSGTTHALEQWPGTLCSHDFCALAINRNNRRTVLLIARSHRRVEEDALAKACRQSDLVIADHVLPATCHPRQILADAAMLARTGGMTVDLANGTARTVAQTSGRHPWLHWP